MANRQHEINKARGTCINGPVPAELHKVPGLSRILVEHGPPVTKGGKCQRCVDVHKRTATKYVRKGRTRWTPAP